MTDKTAGVAPGCNEGLGGLQPERAELGDTVVCEYPGRRPTTIAARLDTPLDVEHANKLLAGNWGWRLLRKGQHEDMCPLGWPAGAPYYVPAQKDVK